MAEFNTNFDKHILFKKNVGNAETNTTEQILTHDEIWNDEALIQHYDEVLKKAQQRLATKLNSGTGTSISDSDCSGSQKMENVNGHAYGKSHHTSHLKKKKKKKCRKKNEWHTGDPCRAQYTNDGKIYEATIIGLDNTSGTCTVRFLGYNNHEAVALSSLLKSRGEGARKKQVEEATEFSQSETEDSCAAESYSGIDYDTNEKKIHKEKKKLKTPPFQSPNAAAPPHSVPHLPYLPPPPALGLIDSNDPMSSEALHTMLMSWYMTGYHTGYYQGFQHGRHSVKPTASGQSQFRNKN